MQIREPNFRDKIRDVYKKFCDYTQKISESVNNSSSLQFAIDLNRRTSSSLLPRAWTHFESKCKDTYLTTLSTDKRFLFEELILAYRNGNIPLADWILSNKDYLPALISEILKTSMEEPKLDERPGPLLKFLPVALSESIKKSQLETNEENRKEIQQKILQYLLDSNGLSAQALGEHLLIMTKKNKLSLVRLVIKQPNEIDETYFDESITASLLLENRDIFNSLINDSRCPSKRIQTAFTQFVEQENKDMAKQLLQSSRVTEQTLSNALQYTVSTSDSDMIRLLLKDTRCSSESVCAAFIRSVKNKNLSALTVFAKDSRISKAAKAEAITQVALGSDPYILEFLLMDPECPTESLITSLTSCVDTGNLSMADILVRDSRLGDAELSDILMHAALNLNMSMIELVLKQPKCPSQAVSSALIQVIKQQGSMAVIYVLMNDSKIENKEISNAFIQAISSPNTEMLKLFLAHPKISPEDISSAFFFSISNRNLPSTKLLMTDKRLSPQDLTKARFDAVKKFDLELIAMLATT